MDARKFYNFFQSKTGRSLIFFMLLAVGALIIFGIRSIRKEAQAKNDEIKKKAEKAAVTFKRKGEVFKPLKKSSSPVKNQVDTNVVVNVQQTNTSKKKVYGQISIYNNPEAKSKVSDNFAPFGRLIPCQLVNTVDSASIETPIIAVVTEDIYHEGKLIIPAGIEVHGNAQPDPSRERIAAQGKWTFVWRSHSEMNGKELSVEGVALDMERNFKTGKWAITDGSAGLKGQVLRVDDQAELRLAAATFVAAAADAYTERDTSEDIFGRQQSTIIATPANALKQGIAASVQQYADRILEQIKKDGVYVRVPAGKQFYLYVKQVIDLEKAELGGTIELKKDNQIKTAFNSEKIK